MIEIWQDIKGYEGKYQVSNLGRVKSLNYNKSGKEHILKYGMNTQGYLNVCLCKNKLGKTFAVHRLVAEAFIENPDNLPQVNHIDEDKHNNCVYNLEWCNSKYNNNYGTHIQRGLLTRIVRNRKTAPKKIDQYSLDGKFIKTWNSGTDIAKNGFTKSSIWKCCNGQIKTSQSYIWKYHELNNMENKIQVINELLKKEQNQKIKELIQLILKEQLNKK